MSTTDLTIFTDTGYVTTLKIAETLVKSGVLPRGIDNPFKAFAIIQKGREIGVGPMRALTGIALIEGKPTVSPELKLEQFRQRGGRVKWIKSDNTVAHLHLKAPNGDEHEEIVTMDDMKLAGVAGKDNWRKYPKSMLRARAVGFGLRALGEGDGSYTPDELGAVTNESGEVVEAEFTEQVRAAVNQDPPEKKEAAPSVAPPAIAATTSKAPRANTIKHDGTFASHKQVALLHMLKAKAGIGDCDGKCAKEVKKWSKRVNAEVPMIVRCTYHGQLAAFKDCDGKPITTSTDLSEAQISNLIDRYEAKIKQQEARPSETPDIAAIDNPNQIFDAATAPQLSELEAAVAGDEARIEAICDTLRVMSISDIRTKERASQAIALAIAFGTGAFEPLRKKIMSQVSP